MRRFIGLFFTGLSVAACTTVPDKPVDSELTERQVEALPNDDSKLIDAAALPLPIPPDAPQTQTPPPVAIEPPPRPVIETPTTSGFASLAHWSRHDPRPALSAFVRGCEKWVNANPDDLLNPNLPQYGRFKDWTATCQSATVLQSVTPSAIDARKFFESWFAPVSLTTPNETEGILTGYYEPEVEVRLRADTTFSAPILAKPTSEEVLKLPRSAVNSRTSRVIAYGRPIDVFFLQIQGSGRLKYKDGRVLRAAYAANNGQSYRSIGAILVERGEMTLEPVSYTHLTLPTTPYV